MRQLTASAVLAAAALVVGCGSDDTDLLADVDASLAEVRAADVRLSLTAAVPEAQERRVGFRLDGSFDFGGDSPLPVLDMEVTELLGADTETTQVRSTGSAVFVVVGEQAYRVPAAETQRLRLDRSDDVGLGDLGISRWVADEGRRERRTGDDVVVEGEVDVAGLLGGLSRAAGALGAPGTVKDVSEDDRRRLRRSVERSRFELRAGDDGRRIERLRASVDFGARVPDAARRALGRYAGVRLEVELHVTPLGRRLTVRAPAVVEEPEAPR